MVICDPDIVLKYVEHLDDEIKLQIVSEKLVTLVSIPSV